MEKYVCIRCSKQIVTPLGTNLNSTITYVVMVVGTNFSKNFTGVTCDNMNRICNLTIQLSTRESYNVSVVASNIYGSGPSAFYAGKIKAESNPSYLAITVTPCIHRMQSRRSW